MHLHTWKHISKILPWEYFYFFKTLRDFRFKRCSILSFSFFIQSLHCLGVPWRMKRSGGAPCMSLLEIPSNTSVFQTNINIVNIADAVQYVFLCFRNNVNIFRSYIEWIHIGTNIWESQFSNYLVKHSSTFAKSKDECLGLRERTGRVQPDFESTFLKLLLFFSFITRNSKHGKHPVQVVSTSCRHKQGLF